VPESRETDASLRVGEVGNLGTICPEPPRQHETRQNKSTMRGQSRVWRTEGTIKISPENAREAKIGAEQNDGIRDGNKEGLDGRLEKLVVSFSIDKLY
jgi:hypothetical protein